MRIDVTQEDINLGHIGDSFNCAIAHALKKDGKFIRVSVSGAEIVVVPVGDGKTRYYNVGAAIRQWIGRFDFDRKSSKPFAFELPDDQNKWLTPIEEEAPMPIPAMIPVKVEEKVHAR